jgi:hypothetical protein
MKIYKERLINHFFVSEKVAEEGKLECPPLGGPKNAWVSRKLNGQA